uniref:Glycosyl hydrolase family 38 C-terminal domain-containing protein n=1 Tax=Oryzias latipes TaxID=8090 RepID=A0A3P9HFT2_ORYLA
CHLLTQAVILFQDDVISAQDALPQKTPLVLSDEPRVLIVYNPTEQRRSSVISVVVSSPDARVVDSETAQPMPVQISAVWVEPQQVSSQAFQLSFVSELPPLSLTVYHIWSSPETGLVSCLVVFLYLERLLRFIFVLLVLLLFSTAEAPPLFRFGPPGPGEIPVVWNHNKQGQEWCIPVPAWAGGGTGEICTSDRDASSVPLTFILPPRSPTPLSPPLVRVSRGPIFSDITSCFQHVTHTVRLFHLEGHSGKSIEISNMVDIRAETNRELVMRLESDVASGNRFYTDLNGFQVQQRRTLKKLPLQANFYPMSSSSFLQDSLSRLTLLSAQSQAVASLQSGELEVVLDRRLQQDDNRGLGQGVTDNKLTGSLYHLLLEDRRAVQEVGGATIDHLSLLAHLESLSLCHPPIIMFAQSDMQLPKLRPFLPLHSSLPCDVHLLNLRTLEETGAPSQEVALLLHRKGFECSSAPEPPPQCTWSAHEEVRGAQRRFWL